MDESTIEEIIFTLKRELQEIDINKTSEEIKGNQDISMIFQLYNLLNLQNNNIQKVQKYNFVEIINKIISKNIHIIIVDKLLSIQDKIFHNKEEILER